MNTKGSWFVLCIEFLQATVEPHTQTVEVTTSASFSCTADGFAVEDISYAWEITETEGIPSRINAATSATLVLHNVTKSSMYRCIVTSVSGSTATSTDAVLSVTGRLYQQFMSCTVDCTEAQIYFVHIYIHCPE